MTSEIKTIFSTLSIIIVILGFIPYLKDALTKKNKPHQFTWLILLITQGISTAILWSKGGGKGSISLTVGTVFIAIILLISLFEKKKNITKSDVSVLIIALSAVPIWLLLNNALLAVIVLSLIDISGYIPTFRKSYSKPSSETTSVWIAFTISNIFAILALESYTLVTLIYLTSITFANISLVTFIYFRKKHISNYQ